MRKNRKREEKEGEGNKDPERERNENPGKKLQPLNPFPYPALARLSRSPRVIYYPEYLFPFATRAPEKTQGSKRKTPIGLESSPASRAQSERDETSREFIPAR